MFIFLSSAYSHNISYIYCVFSYTFVIINTISEWMRKLHWELLTQRGTDKKNLLMMLLGSSWSAAHPMKRSYRHDEKRNLNQSRCPSDWKSKSMFSYSLEGIYDLFGALLGSCYTVKEMRFNVILRGLINPFIASLNLNSDTTPDTPLQLWVWCWPPATQKTMRLPKMRCVHVELS